MQYVIAVFRSRNETLYFANMFRSAGYFASIINTPKEAGQACGISVRFDMRLFALAKQFLLAKPFRSFHGFFRVNEISLSRRVVEKI